MPQAVHVSAGGVEIWFGGADTPLPPDPPATTSTPRFTVAVGGVRAGDQILVRYRVAGRNGQIQLVRVRVADTPSGKATYFSGELNGLRHGDEVAYAIVFLRTVASRALRLPANVDEGAYPYRFTFSAKGSTLTPPVATGTPQEPSSAGTAGGGADPPAGTGAGGTGGGDPISGTPGDVGYMVTGTVTSPDRAGIGGLQIQIVDKNVGNEVLVAQATTDAQGRYRASFAYGATAAARDCRKTSPDLQAKALAGSVLLSASEIRYNASHQETLDIRLPANVAVLPSEYETLLAALAANCSGPLRDLEETEARHDITYLANKTGWDARLIAMAALADRSNHQEATASIDAAFYYALFRAGIPATLSALCQVAASAVGAIWERAITQGVIPAALKNGIPDAVKAFQALLVAHSLDAPAAGGSSTVRAMAQLALGNDVRKLQQFAALYAQHRSDWPSFWKEAEKAFGAATTKRLQLDGRLGALTLNNAPLLAKLHAAEQRAPMAAPSDLAARGYYNAEKWNALLADVPIPNAIPDGAAEARRAGYAALLAAQVRLQFPTAVVAAQVHAGEIPLATTDGDVQSAVHGFLAAHEDRFEIGKQAVDQYLGRNGLTGEVKPAVTEEIKRIQRVYQITPGDEPMIGLLKKNVHSAYQIARFDEEAFVRGFKDDVGGEDTARQVWSRARQVHNAVLNIASHYLLARTSPQIGVHSPGQIVNQTPDDSNPDVTASPTLAQLFSSMDYCSCDHCRSILSPAAYLVDLLHFLDQDPPDNSTSNPQAVLFDRRPDIQHLKLTCENTNTALPYIDIVNETLEYFVAHSSNVPPLLNFVGHDTDSSAQPAELLASPRYVDDAAYAAMRTAIFPPPLPFHKPLETLRRYFDTFGVPLHSAMMTLRASDVIERANDASYGWRDILIEQLGLSREEYRLLTDQTLTVRHLYGYADDDADASAPADLANVETFARRAGLTYAELIAVLETRYINPNSTLLPRLSLLGVPFATLRDLHGGTLAGLEFGKLLPRKLDPGAFGGDAAAIAQDGSNYDQVMGDTIKTWLDAGGRYAAIMSLITIANPNDSQNLCAVNALELRYADPDPKANLLPAIEYVRLLRFIRLWHKLGWTIEQTDRTIAALFPPDPADGKSPMDHLDAGFATFLPRLGLMRQVIERLRLDLDRDLAGLLACWSPIGRHGSDSLYRRMFLSPALLPQDPVFADNGYGEVLQDPALHVIDHVEVLRAAFGLAGDEILLIADEVVRNANDGSPTPNPLLTRATLPLTLDVVSAIYRHGWLARRLALSVQELLLLKQRTGIDPFATLDPAAPPTVGFLDLVERLRAASLKPTQALYLMWDDDLSGKSAPDEGHITDLARTLRAAFAAVESDFAIVDDPDGAIARSRMTLVYGGDATDVLFGLLNNTSLVTVRYRRPPASSPQPLIDAAPGRVAYDDASKQLSFGGFLDAATKALLLAAAGGDQDLQKAVADLDAAAKAAVEPFLNRYPELRPLLVAYAAAPNVPAEQRRATLLAALLLDLKPKRKREQALAAVCAAARADVAPARAILDDAGVLNAAASTTLTALDDFTACETVDGATISGPWDGYVDPNVSGAYRLTVTADVGVTAVSVVIDGIDAQMAASGPGAFANGGPITLTAGRLSRFTLAITGAGALSVQWLTRGQGWETPGSDRLYPATLMDRLRISYTRFLKIDALASGVKLTAGEIAWLGGRADLRINLAPNGLRPWLNALPVSTSVSGAVSIDLRDRLTAVMEFGRFKAALSPGSEGLLAVFMNPGATTADGRSLLLTLSQWDADSLDAILARLGKTTVDLSDLTTFGRVFDCLTLVNAVGISAPALIAATTNDPDPLSDPKAHMVRDLESALRARYDPGSWLQVAQPINDALRTLRRDALVAFVLQKFRGGANSSIDTPNKLFEYFLMDVEMEACMRTSRIRHALSSVQLFIERCLMNLEEKVAPSVLSASQWEWMRRYRVWEASRKVFLWPENWLEPELRDHQSPIFKETMSELLQSDITEDAAEVALLNYLAKLEEIAKLEPCGMYYEDETNVHVVARTAGAHRKYFYRRMQDGSWLPWEQIKLEIEDNPVVPYLWKGRLLLFWLKVLKQGPTEAALPAKEDLKTWTKTDLASTAPVLTVHAVLCWSEFHNGKWQPARTSDINRPAPLWKDAGAKPFSPNGLDPATSFDRSAMRLGIGPGDGPDGTALRVIVTYDPGESGSPLANASFLFHNTHSLPDQADGEPTLVSVGNARALKTLEGDLTITFTDADAPSEEHVIASLFPSATRTTEPLQGLNSWGAPFFYADGRHVFYVKTSSTSVLKTDPATGSYGPGDLGPLIDGVVNKLGIDAVIHRPLRGDPGPMESRVSEDANIGHLLSGTRTVQYGAATIGASGVQGRQALNLGGILP